MCAVAAIFSRLGNLVSGAVRNVDPKQLWERVTAAPQPDDDRVHTAELTAGDAQLLTTLRRLSAQVVLALYDDVVWKRSRHDVAVVQRLVDDRAFGAEQTMGLMSLGVALGDVLEAEGDWQWVSVCRGQESEPRLQHQRSRHLVDGVRLLVDAVESGGTVHVEQLLAKAVQAAAPLP